MRGTPDDETEHLDQLGIIPAYAGNTQWRVECFLAHWDHPRVCGEHQGVDGDFARLPGSSPRMRGTPSNATWAATSTGIIPAYAGNTRIGM